MRINTLEWTKKEAQQAYQEWLDLRERRLQWLRDSSCLEVPTDRDGLVQAWTWAVEWIGLDENHPPAPNEPMPPRSAVEAMDPTPEQVERGAGVLGYFVTPFNLPLNPETLHELAYAVLAHHDSTASWEEIGAAVEAQIAGHIRDLEKIDAAHRDPRDEDPGASS